jgi:hypothetical protein
LKFVRSAKAKIATIKFDIFLEMWQRYSRKNSVVFISK